MQFCSNKCLLEQLCLPERAFICTALLVHGDHKVPQIIPFYSKCVSLYKPHTEWKLKMNITCISCENVMYTLSYAFQYKKLQLLQELQLLWAVACTPWWSSRLCCKLQAAENNAGVWADFVLDGIETPMCVFSSRETAGKLKQLPGITKPTKQFGRSRLVLHWRHDVSSDECGEDCWKWRELSKCQISLEVSCTKSDWQEKPGM